MGLGLELGLDHEHEDLLCFQGKGTADEDFIWMWSQFQNKSYSKLTEASVGNIPEVILWSSHLTNEDNIHNLVRRFKMRASQYNFHLSRIQKSTQSKFGLTLVIARTRPSGLWRRGDSGTKIVV